VYFTYMLLSTEKVSSSRILLEKLTVTQLVKKFIPLTLLFSYRVLNNFLSTNIFMIFIIQLKLNKISLI
jgi:hypothetical protein